MSTTGFSSPWGSQRHIRDILSADDEQKLDEPSRSDKHVICKPPMQTKSDPGPSLDAKVFASRS